MKKLLSIALAALLLVPCFCLTACGDSVEGNTYKFDSFRVVYEGDKQQSEVKDQIDHWNEYFNYELSQNANDVNISFEKDGKCLVTEGGKEVEYTYVQEDGKVTIKGLLGVTFGILDVDGNKLIQKTSLGDDFSLEYTYKK